MTRTLPTDEWGIDASWLDALDEEHEVAEATIHRLREVIGTPLADLEDRAPIVARPGDPLEVDEAEETELPRRMTTRSSARKIAAAQVSRTR